MQRKKALSSDTTKGLFLMAEFIMVHHGILGANKGLGEAPKAARGRSMKARPTQSRGGVKGGDFVPFRLPLAGSRDSVPCGVWGNAPTVPRATSIANALNKGAGSEASLPVTLRVRRRAPKLLLPPRFRDEPIILPHEKRPALSRLPSDDSLYRCSGFVFSTLMAEIAQLSVRPVDGNCK